MRPEYDVVIIGGGPAGLAAALYTSRYGLKTMILEKEVLGGELINRELIENYPGFGEGVEGPELASGMMEQAMNFGAGFESAEVTGVELRDDCKVVVTGEGTYSCRAIIVTSGSHPKLLGVPGEEEYDHRGVFYCATCDGPLYAGKDIVIAGGGDSGFTDALSLTNIVNRITIVEFLDTCKATNVLQDRAAEDTKITVLSATKIEAITGDGEHMTGVELEDRNTGVKTHVDAEGILVRIGLIPNTQFLKGVVDLTPAGQVIVDPNMMTSVPGIFAAGDIRQYSPQQISTAVGDGVVAAMSLNRYLQAN